MKRFVIAAVVACGVFSGTTREASAQGASWADRGYINVGWGVESGSTTLTDSLAFTKYDEPATVTSTSSFTSGSLFDVGVGIRIWRNLTIGGAYHQEQNDADGLLTGQIPSPVFFNRPRALTATVENLDRKEQATHLQIGWVIPIGAKFDAMVFGGPSFFRLTQDVVAVTGANIGEQGGAVVAQPTIVERKKSQTGYNVGVDATYIVWQNDSVRLGAGGFMRYALATTDVEMLTTAQPTDLGGLQFGFGARIRF